VLKRIPGPAWTLLDQALSSGANFLTLVLLARAMSPSQLGIYALAFTSLYLFGNIQRAVFIDPHYVYGVEQADYRGYTSATACGQLALACAVAIVGVCAAWTAPLIGVSDAGNVLGGFAVVAIPYLVQDFMRGLFFTEARFRAVFLNDLVAYGGQLVLVALLVSMSVATPERALSAVGISSWCAVMLGLWQFRHIPTWPVPLRASLRTNWQMGKWLSTSTVASAGASELYLFLTSGMLGAAAAGAYRAVVSIVNVNNVFLVALVGRTLPRASERLRDGGKGGLDDFLRRLIQRDAAPVYVMSTLIIVFGEQILGTLYGDDYRAYAGVLRVIAIGMMLQIPFEVCKVGLKARGLGAPMLVISALSAALTIGLGIPMLRVYGLHGVAYANLFDVILMNGIIWSIYRRARSRPVTDGSAVSEASLAPARPLDLPVEAAVR
jgi:O-antigen/teichoic acid export membrane protein